MNNAVIDNRNEMLGFLMIALATLGMGLQANIVKLSFAEHMPLLVLLVVRKIIFFPFFGLYLYFKTTREKLFRCRKRDILFAMAVGVLGHYIMPLANFHALQVTSAGVVTVLLFSYPLFVILINSWLRKTWPSRFYILTFLVMQLGIILVIGGGNMTLFEQNLKGSYIVICAAVGYAIFTMLMHNAASRLGALPYMFYALLGGFTASFIHYLFELPLDAMLDISSKGTLLLCIFALVCFVPAILIAEGIQRIGVARTSLITATTPFLTIVLAYFMLGEILTPLQLLGGVIVVGSVLMLEKKMLRFLLPRGRKAKIYMMEPTYSI